MEAVDLSMFLFGNNSSLSALIKAGRLGKLQKLVNIENCNEPDEMGHAPLYYAISYNQVKIARYLLELGCQPATGAESLQQPVMARVVLSLSLPMVELFLEFGETLPDYIDGLPLLHSLVMLNKVNEKHFRFYMERGFDINDIDQRTTDRTVLAYYVGQDDVRIDSLRVEWLLKLGADVNKASQSRYLPVVAALENTALHDRQDTLSITTFESVFKKLLPGKPELNVQIGLGGSSLGTVAVQSGKYRSFLVLVEHGLTIPDEENEQMENYLTTENFGVLGMKKLIDLNQQRNLGLPLTIVQYTIPQVKRIVAGLHNNAPANDKIFFDLVTATNYTKEEKLSLLDTLLAKGADVNTVGSWAGIKMTALQEIPTYQGVEHREAIVNWLLDHGAQIEYQGRSALFMALWMNQPQLVTLFVERGADLFYQEHDGSTLLSKLFTMNPQGAFYPVSDLEAMLRRLQALFTSRGLSLPLAEPFRYSSDDPQNPALSITLPLALTRYAAEPAMRLMEWLLEAGWSLNTPIVDNDGDTGNIVTHFLMWAKKGSDISEFLERHPELDVNSEAAGDALRWAIVSQVSLRTLDILASRVEDINRPVIRSFKNSIMLQTTENYLHYSIHRLADLKCDESYVHDVVALLLRHGVAVNAPSHKTYIPEYQEGGYVRKEDTPLEIAASHRFFTVFQLLLDHGADPHLPMCAFGEHFIHWLVGRVDTMSDEEKFTYIEELERRGLFDIEEQADKHQATPLVIAASKCRTTMVRYLLDKGANPDAVGGFDYSSSLHRAITNWNWVSKEVRRETVEALLDAGADTTLIDPDGDTPLMAAAGYGCLTAVSALLEHGADANLGNDKGFRPIHTAVFRHCAYDFYPDDPSSDKENECHEPLQVSIIEKLLEHGADINAATKDNGDTALLMSIIMNRPRITKALLKAGADARQANAEGRTPLMMAIQYGSSAIINMLVQRVGDEGFLVKANNGNSMLHACAMRQDHEMSGALYDNLMEQSPVEYGTNDAGQTPMHYAAYTGNNEVVRRCCEAGHDVNVQDEKGDTPLHCATYFDGERTDYEAIKMVITTLVTAGAQPDLANEAQQTPLAVAREREMQECVAMMTLVHGATPLN